jgi:hypothetical protein
MTMQLVFGLLVVLFAVIGSLRGWAKELLVSCSLVLAMFVNMLLDKYASGLLSSLPPAEVFGVRAGVFALMTYFGYLTPRLPWVPADRFLRERLQDWLLGAVLGAVNGFLLFGSIWFFLHKAGYPWIRTGAGQRLKPGCDGDDAVHAAGPAGRAVGFRGGRRRLHFRHRGVRLRCAITLSASAGRDFRRSRGF